MPSSFFSVQLSTLTGLGARLGEVSQTIRAGVTFPGAQGAEHYEILTSAVSGFRDDWDNAVARLAEKIDGWGEVTSRIGAAMAEHDRSLAGSWRGSAGW